VKLFFSSLLLKNHNSSEILELGFDTLELSHGMTITKLPGLQKAYAEKKFKCVGVHNFFPSPVEVMIDAPDAYEYTSFREYERQRAMDMTLKTLDVAAEFDAKYLVLHMGSVPKMPHKKWTKKLTTMLKDGQGEDKKYEKLKQKCIKKRTKTGGLYIKRAIEALEKIAERAAELHILLAVESRSKFEDTPNEEEMVYLQDYFRDHPQVGYWHDFGHVHLKHNLGLLHHPDWLKSMQPYLIGAHLHDVEWPARDHRVPFTGEINYDELVPLFPEGAPFTWELSPTRKADQIEMALAAWKMKYPQTLS